MCICAARVIPADLAHRLAAILERHFTHDRDVQADIEAGVALLRGEPNHGAPTHHPEQSAGAKGAT